MGSDGGDSATVKNLPASVLQALYNEFTGKTESINRRFEGNYVARMDDFINYIERITQHLGQYQTKIADVQLQIKLFDGTVQYYSSYYKFKSADTSLPGKIQTLECVFSFLIATPAVEKYQNYRIILTFNSFGLHKDFGNLRFGSRERNLGVEFKIEYVDYIVARSVMAVCEDWIKTLDQSIAVDERRFFKFEYEALGNFVALIIQISICFLAIGLTFLLSPPQTFVDSIRWLLVISVAYTFGNFIGKLLIEIYAEKFWFFGKYPFVLITRGDMRNFEIFQEKYKANQRVFRRILYGFAGAILSNILAAVVMILIGLQKI